jgi:hypothetical protein
VQVVVRAGQRLRGLDRGALEHLHITSSGRGGPARGGGHDWPGGVGVACAVLCVMGLVVGR